MGLGPAQFPLITQYLNNNLSIIRMNLNYLFIMASDRDTKKSAPPSKIILSLYKVTVRILFDFYRVKL
jgi:hypothetical protein